MKIIETLIYNTMIIPIISLIIIMGLAIFGIKILFNNKTKSSEKNDESLDKDSQYNTSNTKGSISLLTAVLLFIPLTTIYYIVSGLAILFLMIPFSKGQEDSGLWAIALIVCPIISPILAIIHLAKMMSIKKDSKKTKNNDNKYIHNNYQA